jgi:dihydrofolate reductase
MRRIVYSVAMSLDGYLAGPNGEADWIVMDSEIDFAGPGLTIIGEHVGGAVSKLRAASGKDIWLFGGGVLFRSLLELGLVDTVEVGVIPVLLGGGIPLLPSRSQRTTLRLVGSKVYKASGIAGLEYAVQ